MQVFPVDSFVSDSVTKINKIYPLYTSKNIIKLYDPVENTCIVVRPEDIPNDQYDSPTEFLIGKHELTSVKRPVKFHFVLDRNDYSSQNRLNEVLDFVLVSLRDYLVEYSRAFLIYANNEIPHLKKEDFCVTYTNHSIEVVFKNYFYFNNVTSNNRFLILMMSARDDIIFQYKYTSRCKNTLAISDDIQSLHALIHYIPDDHERKCVAFYTRRQLDNIRLGR